jgi:hypothetical protein
MKANIHFLSYLAQFFLVWKMFQTDVVEKIKTHFLCSITFFFKSCRFFRYNGKFLSYSLIALLSSAGRPQMTIRRMRIACWMPKSTNTLSEYVILISFPLQQWLYERASLLRYTYIASPVIPHLLALHVPPMNPPGTEHSNTAWWRIPIIKLIM